MIKAKILKNYTTNCQAKHTTTINGINNPDTTNLT